MAAAAREEDLGGLPPAYTFIAAKKPEILNLSGSPAFYGAYGTRTRGLHNAIVARSQLR